jgi:hypothetical protein
MKNYEKDSSNFLPSTVEWWLRRKKFHASNVKASVVIAADTARCKLDF